MTVTITGDKKIDRRLQKMGKASGKIAAAGVRAAQGEVVKGIKASIPPSAPKSIKRTVGRRFKKSKRTGQRESKVGFGVGKQKPPNRPESEPGVGMSKNNIHWWVLGTDDRYTKSGRYTGRMPAKGENVTEQGFARSERPAVEAATKKIDERIQKEAKKS